MLCEALVLLGELDRGVAAARVAVAEARASGHALTLCGVLSGTTRVLLRVWDGADVLSWCAEAAAIAEEKGFPYYLATAKVRAGWLMAMQGREQDGADTAADGLRDYEATGARWNAPMYAGFVIQAQEAAGRQADALGSVAKALEVVEATEERGEFLAELLRLRGQLLEGTGDPGGAEASFRDALSVARDQGAKLWELRAAVSLARLWRRQNNAEGARELLAPVYARFTEGFAMPDLARAKALLEEL